MSITWNGVSSDTIGVIVERIPNRYVPTRRFSPQQVAGRNGNILLVDKAFPNVEQEYEVYLSAEAQGLPSVARACAEWLMGPDGYCRLEDSYDTTVYREAFLMGGYDLENILNKFGRCTITFSCKPQKYLLTGDTPISFSAGSTTTYTGSSVQFDGITGASITSLSTTITPTQAGSGDPSPTNVRPITGLTGLSVYVSPTQDQQDATVYNVDWTSQAGTVYSGTVDVVTGQLTVDGILEVFNVVGTDTIRSQINEFKKTRGTVATIGDYTRISFDVRGAVDQTQYNRVSSGYNYKISNMLKHYFAYNDQSAHWYRNTVLYAFFPTSLVGSTAQSVYDYLVSIKDTTPLSVWLELATPLTYQLTAQDVEALVGTNNVWISSGDVSVTVTTPFGGIVTNPTPFEARPMLEVSGVGEITINGKTIQILESVSDFDIDCEAMEAEDNSKIYCMDFPYLEGGENEIVGDVSITSLTVVPRWWTL